MAALYSAPAGEPAAQSDQPSDTEQSIIRSLSSEWITTDTVNDSNPSLLSLSLSNDDEFSIRMRVRASLSNENIIPIGNISLKIPKNIVTDRTGTPTGRMTFAVPPAPDDRASFAYSDMGDYYCLTNTREIQQNATMSFEFSIVDLVPHTINGGGAPAYTTTPWTAALEVTDENGTTYEEQTGDDLVACFATSESVSSSYTRHEGTSSRWRNNFPSELKPENVDDYVYMDFYSWGVPTGNQAHDATLSGTVSATGMAAGAAQPIILGVKAPDGSIIKGNGTSALDARIVSSAWSRAGYQTWYAHTYVAIPKASCPAGGRYNIILNNAHNLTPVDTQASSSRSSRASKEYYPMDYTSAGGHWGIGASGYNYYPLALNTLREGNSQLVRFSTNALGFGYQNTWEDVNGDGIKDEDEMNRKSYAVIADLGDLTLSSATVNADTSNPDIRMSSITVSTPQLYDWTEFETDGRGYGAQPSDGSQNIYAGEWGYKPTTSGIAKLSFYATETVEGIGTGSLIATMTFTNGKLTSSSAPHNDVSISGNQIVFSDASKITHVFMRAETASGGISASCSQTYEALPTDNMRNVATRAFENDDAPQLNLHSQTSLWSQTGSDPLPSGTPLVRSGVWDYLQGASLAVQPSVDQKVDNDTANRIAKISITASVTEQSNIRSATDLATAQEAGYIAEDTSCVWRALLPPGTVIDLDSVSVRDKDSIESMKLVRNFRDSGRDMLVVKVSLSPQFSYAQRLGRYGYGDIPTLKYDLYYTWEDKADYGDIAENIVAYESFSPSFGTIDGYKGEPDTPSAGNNATSGAVVSSIGTLLDNLSDEETPGSFVYGRMAKPLNIDTYAVAGFTKSATATGKSWSTGADDKNLVKVVEGGSYTYRLRYTNGAGADTGERVGNIVFYDALDSGAGSEWAGQLCRIDTRNMTHAGVSPVIYYSTQSLDMNDEANRNLSDTSKWSTSVPAGGMSAAKSIAVDASKATDGSDFTLDADASIAVDIVMRASRAATIDSADPSSVFVGEDNMGGKRAANTGYISSSLADGTGTSTITPSSTIAGLTPFTLTGQLSMDDDKDRDGKRPNDVRVVLLANGEDTGKHIDVTLPEQNVAGTGTDDPVAFDFTGLFDDLYAADENGDDIFYSVAVVLPDGTPVADYDLRSDSQRSEGEQFIDTVLVHDPEQIVLTGEKVWAGETEGDGHARPASVKLGAVDIYGKTVKTTTATSANGWAYEFPSLPAYNRIGVPATYIVEEQAYIPGYVPSVSGTTVTNTYHPYGDLIIRNDYRPEDEAATPQAAKDKKATYTIDILRSGEPVSGEWAFVRSDGESGTVSNGSTIEIPFGQSVTIKDLPSDVSYRVMQELPGGWSKISTAGDTGTILAGRTSTATFTNKYASSARLYVRAKKTLDGRDLVYRQFAVIMYNVDTGRQYRAFNDREGNFALQGIEYTSADDGRDITFVIAEEQQSLAGYMMDGSIYCITATVHDNGDGTISFDNMRTVKIADENGDAVDAPEAVGEEGIVFANIYRSSGEVNLAAWKTLSGGALSDDQFSFTLTDDGTGEVIQTKGNKADGTIPFDPISYNQYNAGEKHSYTVREVVDENDADITYDKSSFTYTVEVVDNGHGKLEFNTGLVKTSEDGSSVESDEPVFRNVSKPGSLEISKRLASDEDDPSAEHKFRVTFAGEDLEDGDWTFTRSEAKKRLQDYTAAELAAIADKELSAKGEESAYWDQFQEYMQNDEKWYYTLSDGTEMSFRIVGINHDTKSWAPNGEKAGLTMQAVELLPKTYKMNETATNNGGWRDSALRASMNNSSGEIYQLFAKENDSENLLNYVATVDKMMKNRDDGTSTNDELKNIQPTATADKLWIMSFGEIAGVYNHNRWSSLENEGTQYKYWIDKDIQLGEANECLYKYVPGGTLATTWWFRSIEPGSTTNFCCVTRNGNPTSSANAEFFTYGVAPCFCFGESFEPPEYWIDVPADNVEAQALGVAGKRLLPESIVAAAKDIANNKDSSKYYPMYKSFMDNDVHMKVNWGDGQQYDVRIVGFNHDDITGGDGKAGITWQFVDLLNDAYRMNNTATNYGGWRDSALRANMNSGTIWSQVPETLAQDILAVDKLTKNRDDGTATSTTLAKIQPTATSDKLWIMSYSEISNTYPAICNGLEGEGSQYEYWNGKVKHESSDNECLKKKPSIFGWWERSITPSLSANFLKVTANGNPTLNDNAGLTNGVCPCFCMGEPEPEFWIERKDKTIMKPAEIKKAADSIAELAEDSPYYPEFKDFMDNGGDWDTDNNAPGATFGQALESGYGLMHIKWGDGREYTARIVGINHDELSDGSGTAGLTWQFTGLLYNPQRFNPTNSNNGGWRDSELRFRMNPAELGDGNLMEGAKTDHAVWDAVPASLQCSIVDVNKLTKNRDDGTTSNNGLANIKETATRDKLWIMSYPELMETYASWMNGLMGEGVQYKYWNGKVANNFNNNDCLKKYPAKQLDTSNQPTSSDLWWERSVGISNSVAFTRVGRNGDTGNSTTTAAGALYICPCFCLGSPNGSTNTASTASATVLSLDDPSNAINVVADSPNNTTTEADTISATNADIADDIADNASDNSEENAFSVPLLDYFFGDDTPAADAAETSDNNDNGTDNGNNSAYAMRTMSGALVGSLPIASSVASGCEGMNVPLRSSLLSMPNAYSTETVGVDAIPEFAKAETRALYVNTASGDVDLTLPASGYSGDEVQWEIDENGVLTLTPTNGVSGTLKKSVMWYGVIGNAMMTHSCPGWWDYRELIKEIRVADGKTINLPSDASKLFALHNQLTTLDMIGFNTDNVKNMSNMFVSCSSLVNLDFPNDVNTSSVEDMSYMFYRCSSLTNLILNNFKTNNVMNMNFMFSDCSSLLSLDLSSFDTHNVTDMHYMFHGCSFLENLKFSNSFNTNSVTHMNFMFSDCSSLLNLDLSSFGTNNVTYMHSMFHGCSSLISLKFSNDFNTSSVKDMSYMFAYCHSLTNLNLNSFNTSNVEDMSFMFSDCSSLLSLDLSSFDTHNVTDMHYMFYQCSSLASLDLSSFNTNNVTTMSAMFFRCLYLSRITLSSSFVIPETNPPSFSTPNSQYVNYPVTGKWISKDAQGEKGPYTSAELLNALVTAGTDTLAFAGTWEWERKDLSYTIEFNQGTLPDADASSTISGSMPSITADAGYPCTIPSKTGYYAFGYKVTGWKDDTNNKMYTSGEVLSKGIPGAQKDSVITLTAVWEKDTNAAAMKDNVLEFSLHGGETAHFDNIPSGTTYKIEELTQSGWKLVGTDGDTEGTITPNVTSTANFTNTPDPENTTPMTVNITGTKAFDGTSAAGWSFELLDENDTKIDETMSGDDGMFTFTHELTNAEKNGNAGRYTIREVIDTNNTAVSYDDHEAHITVSLVDGYATATLDEGDTLSFANATAPARIIIDEHLTGQAGDGDPDAEITYRVEGGPSPEDIVTITIKPSDDPKEIPVVPGYPVKIIPVDVPDGYTIDIPEDGITLDPIDPGEEKQADVSVTYTITGIGYIKINKVLEGADLIGGDFAFSLYRASKSIDSRGAALPLVTNSAEGTALYPISFEGAPSDGDRSLWWLTENGEPMLDVWKNRVDMDDTRYDVYITWQDNGDGTATPVIEYPDSEDAFTFTNRMRTGNVEIVKTVEGTTPVSEDTPFEYTITVTPPDDMPDDAGDNGDKTWSVLYPDGHREEVPDGGTIEIVPGEENKIVIENIPVGYTVEVAPTDTPDGFDNTPDNEGKVTVPEDSSDSRIDLVSRYSSIGDAEITVQKQARGFDLADVSFTFSARNTETGEIIEGTSDGAGNVLFDLGEVTAADHRRKVVFDVCEVANGSASYDWDDLHASVTVSFVDDGKGHMAARIDDWHYIDDTGAGVSDGLVLDAEHAQFQEESASPVFVNTFLLSLPFTGGAGLPIALIVLGALLAGVGSVVIIRNKKRNAMKKDYQHRCERKNEKREAWCRAKGI